MRSDSADLPRLVLEATADNAKWAEVLKELIRASGALKGVISLRDLKSAQLYFPEEATSELSAPLIIGIEPEHVESYFERFAECDVWTPIEQQHHPYSPYFMSEYIGFEALKRTEFWGWLEPQGICDCLVAEIHRSRGYWVAINLHFDESAFDRKNEILAHLAALLPEVRTGWSLSERLIGLDQQQAASRGYLENWPTPSLILDEELVVTAANSLALREFNRHAALARPLSIGEPIVLRDGPLRQALSSLHDNKKGCGPHNLLTAVSRCDGHMLQVSAIAQGTDLVGRKRARFLVLARPISDDAHTAVAPQTPRIWETGSLTRMQSAIVKWIAEGGQVPEFARQHQISKNTAYDHLFAARQKLDGISARDIYTSHQALMLVAG